MGRYTKAVVGALVAGLGALQTALVDDRVTGNEWVMIASTTLAALGLVWGVPNSPDKGRADPVDPVVPVLVEPTPPADDIERI